MRREAVQAMSAKPAIFKRRAWSLIGLLCTALPYEARGKRDCGVLRSRIPLLVN